MRIVRVPAVKATGTSPIAEANPLCWVDDSRVFAFARIPSDPSILRVEKFVGFTGLHPIQLPAMVLIEVHGPVCERGIHQVCVRKRCIGNLPCSSYMQCWSGSCWQMCVALVMLGGPRLTWPRKPSFLVWNLSCRMGVSKVIRASAKGDQWALALLLLAEMEKEGRLDFIMAGYGWFISR